MNFAPMTVNVLGFKVNVMERSATLSFGPIQQNDVFNSTKRNQGYGEENGDLVAVYLPINFVNDSDFSDSNSQKTSII